MNKKTICHPRHWILLAVLVAVLLLSACQAQPDRAATTPGRTSSPVPTTIPPILAGERPLPFRTISWRTSLAFFSKADFFARSDFFVITSVGEIQKPKSQIADVELYFSDDVIAELRAVDYQRDFVVLVFRKAAPTTQPDPRPEITGITRRADAVTLYARFDPSTPIGGAPAIAAFPYHLVTISKTEVSEWGRDIRFVLILNGKEVSEHTHFVP
jgi:hypothetical protein